MLKKIRPDPFLPSEKVVWSMSCMLHQSPLLIPLFACSSMIDIHCFIRSSITLISIKKASCLIVFKNILSDQEANHKTLIICRLRLFVAYEDSIGNDESEENKNEGDTYTRCNLRTGKYPLSP